MRTSRTAWLRPRLVGVAASALAIAAMVALPPSALALDTLDDGGTAVAETGDAIGSTGTTVGAAGAAAGNAVGGPAGGAVTTTTQAAGTAVQQAGGAVQSGTGGSSGTGSNGNGNGSSNGTGSGRSQAQGNNGRGHGVARGTGARSTPGGTRPAAGATGPATTRAGTGSSVAGEDAGPEPLRMLPVEALGPLGAIGATSFVQLGRSPVGDIGAPAQPLGGTERSMDDVAAVLAALLLGAGLLAIAGRRPRRVR